MGELGFCGRGEQRLCGEMVLTGASHKVERCVLGEAMGVGVTHRQGAPSCECMARAAAPIAACSTSLGRKQCLQKGSVVF